MKKEQPSRKPTCVLAEALGMFRFCIWDYDCHRCSFVQWLEESPPESRIPSQAGQETSVGAGPAERF